MTATPLLQAEGASEVKRDSSLRQFSRQIGEEADSLRGKSLLFEVDPSTTYEKVLKDFAEEFSSSGLFIFTQRSSRVYRALSANTNFGFFALSNTVSYPKKSDRPNEYLIPQNDSAIYLDLMTKTLESSGVNPVVFIFDSLSDMIISSGFLATYKFLKSAIELVGPNATCLYLAMPTVHDSKITSMIRSMFSNHIEMDYASRVRFAKKP